MRLVRRLALGSRGVGLGLVSWEQRSKQKCEPLLSKVGLLSEGVESRDPAVCLVPQHSALDQGPYDMAPKMSSVCDLVVCFPEGQYLIIYLECIQSSEQYSQKGTVCVQQKKRRHSSYIEINGQFSLVSVFKELKLPTF